MLGAEDRAMLAACWAMQTIILDRLAQADGQKIVDDLRSNALRVAPKNRRAAELLLYVADELKGRHHQPATKLKLIEGDKDRA